VEIVLGPSTVLSDADGDPNNGTAQATTTVGGTYYAHVVGKSGAGLLAQYLLDAVVTIPNPPLITGTSLPAEGTTSTAVIDRLSLNFSEDMAALTVLNPANFDLRAAGPDHSFGTADDQVYTL